MSESEMRPYIVRQGDYLTRLAHERSFDADEVWNHDHNSNLRNRRSSMDVLAPGDVLWLPVPAAGGGIPIASGESKHLKARVPRTSIKVTLVDPENDHQPLANEPYVLYGTGEPKRGQTESDGSLTVEIGLHIREVRVHLYERGIMYPVRVGHLDPAEEQNGVRQRLQHLGYYGWSILQRRERGEEDDSVDWDARAIVAFQRDNDIEPTGRIDEATLSALRDVHGS